MQVRGMKWTSDGQRICIIYEDGEVIGCALEPVSHQGTVEDNHSEMQVVE